MPYTVITNSGELYHHGILGQKWGKRNGPPYPLGASDHSAREKKAGWTKSLKKTGTAIATYRKDVSSAKKRRETRDADIQKRYFKDMEDIERGYKRGQNLSEKDQKRENAADDRATESWKKSKEQYKADKDAAKKELSKTIDVEKVKKVAKIGAAVAVTGLAAYGAYKVTKSGIMAKGREAERNAIRLMREGISTELNGPGVLTATTRGGKHSLRVAMDQNRFNTKSSLAKNTYDYTSKVIDTGQTSALRVFDNIVKGSASQATYSLDRNSTMKNGFAGRISDGEYLMGDLSMDLFNKWRYEGPYRVLKNLE